MIKLESVGAGLSVSSIMALESQGGNAAIGLIVEDYRMNRDGKWEDDPGRKRQLIRFQCGTEQVELSGVVTDEAAVAIGACWRVVLEVLLGETNLPAYEAGRMSRSLTRVYVVRVLEVWSGPGKKLWAAAKGLPESGGKSFDSSTGKIS